MNVNTYNITKNMSPVLTQLGCTSHSLALLRHALDERVILTSSGARFHSAGARNAKNFRACSPLTLGRLS